MPQPSSLLFFPLLYLLSFNSTLSLSGVHILYKLPQPSENSRRQKSDMNQIPRLGLPYIKYHRTICCRLCELAHWDLFTPALRYRWHR